MLAPSCHPHRQSRPPGIQQSSWRLSLAAPVEPHAKDANIAVLWAGNSPFKVKHFKQNENTSKNKGGKALFCPRVLRENRLPLSLGDQKGHPQYCLLWGKVGQARSDAAQPWPLCSGDGRPMAGGTEIPRLLPCQFPLKLIKMKCKPKSLGKKGQNFTPACSPPSSAHCALAWVPSLLRFPLHPGSPALPRNSREWPHCR